jgi:hypothetical protein
VRVRSLVLVVAALFALSSCASHQTTGATSSYELTGTVVAEPGCPGPVRPDSPCPPRAVPGARVDADVNGSAARSTTTDAQGRFGLILPAGRYEIRVVISSGYRASASQTVTLVADTKITVTVDSGLR